MSLQEAHKQGNLRRAYELMELSYSAKQWLQEDAR